MKSSDAVFMRQNPFPPEPLLARIHYNPSRAKKISKQQKKLALSPVRFDRGISPEPPPQSSSPSLEDERFPEESHCVVLCPPPSVKGRQSFSECWPSTDLDSSCVNPGFFKEYQTSEQHTMTRGTQEPSVLAKYIERFRYGRPQSREERQRLEAAGEDEQPFWRTSTSHPSPSSSTPTQASKEQFRGSFDCKNDGNMHNPAGPNNSLFPTKGLLDLSVLALSDSSHGDPGEPEIVQLQERASRLLQKSKNSLSSGSDEIPISSEGLGCSDFSSPVSADEPVRAPLVPFVMDTANLLTPSLSGEGPISAHSALGTRSHFRPEDDILFQWRLRRKMEQARQWSHTSSNSSSFHQPVLASVAQQPGPVSASAPHRTTFSFTPTPVEQTGPINSSVACTNHQPALTISAPSIQTHSDSVTCGRLVPFPQPVKDKAALDPQKPCTLPQPHQKIQGNSSETSVEPCSKDQTPSSPSPQPSEGTEREWLTYQRREDRQAKGRAVVERDGKKTVPFTRKKIDRHAGHGHGVESSQCVEKASGRHSKDQEKVSCKTKKSRREKRWHSGGQNSTGDVRSGDRAPPPSPIHNTLGQVVSEVLFPDSDSPDQPRTPCSSYSSRGTPHSPPQSPTPPPPQSIPQPAELIGQLMQEAQDSDGLEFEDDPLLLVLRQQRKWVKEQLCEVDKMLEKLHKD